jgi:hypothetical protein
VSYIDWNAGQEAATAYGTETANANAMLDQSLRLRALNALHGYNANNPDSVNASVNALGGLGMFEQATAASNLAKTSAINRAITSQVPAAMSDQQPQEGQMDTALHERMLTDGKAALDDLVGTTDPTERQQKAQGWKDYFQRTYNISGADIDQEMGDYNDVASLKAHQAELGRQLQTYTAAHQPGVQDAMSRLNNPALTNPVMMGAFAGAGADPTAGLNLAERLASGVRAGETGLAYTGPTAYQQAAGTNLGGAATAGAVGQVAAAEAGGTAAGQAPFGSVEINMGDGSKIQAHPVVGANGQVTWKQIEPTPAGGGAGAPAATAGAGGAPALANNTGFGAAPSPQAQTTLTAGANQLVADRASNAASVNQQVALHKVLDLLPTTNTGPGTQVTNQWRSFVISQLPWAEKFIPGWDVNQAAVQTANTNELKKYMVQIAGAMAGQYGQGTNEKLAFAASGNPNTEMDALSAKDVTRTTLAVLRAQLAKTAIFQQEHPNPADAGLYGAFADNYARTVDPRAFMLDMMTKAERQRLVSSITSPSDRKRFAQGVIDAEKAGFIDRNSLPQ